MPVESVPVPLRAEPDRTPAQALGVAEPVLAVPERPAAQEAYGFVPSTISDAEAAYATRSTTNDARRALNSLELPLSFQKTASVEVGTLEGVQYMAQTRYGALYFLPNSVLIAPAAPQPNTNEAVQELAQREPIQLQFLLTSPAVRIVPADMLPGRANYFIGSDTQQWKTDQQLYAGVHYKGIYPGIDVLFNGKDGDLKGTYTIAPEADPTRIQWAYRGAERVWVDHRTGDLHVAIAGQAGELIEQVPIAWQERDGIRTSIAVRYQVQHGMIHFSVVTMITHAH